MSETWLLWGSVHWLSQSSLAFLISFLRITEKQKGNISLRNWVCSPVGKLCQDCGIILSKFPLHFGSEPTCASSLNPLLISISEGGRERDSQHRMDKDFQAAGPGNRALTSQRSSLTCRGQVLLFIHCLRCVHLCLCLPDLGTPLGGVEGRKQKTLLTSYHQASLWPFIIPLSLHPHLTLWFYLNENIKKGAKGTLKASHRTSSCWPQQTDIHG